MLFLKIILLKSSFNNLEFWLDEIKDYADGDPEILLLGNKSDLYNLKEIGLEEVKVCLFRFFLGFMGEFFIRKRVI